MRGHSRTPSCAQARNRRIPACPSNVPLPLSIAQSSANLGSFLPGVTADYNATLAATVTTSTANATLSVHDASTTGTGHLVQGSYVLPQALQVRAGSGAFAPVGGASAPTPLVSYPGNAGYSAAKGGMDGLTRAQERLGGDAGPIGALPAHQLPLDDGHPQAPGGHRPGAVLPRCAPTEQDHVEVAHSGSA